MPGPFLRGPQHPGRARFSARQATSFNEYRDSCGVGSVTVTGIAAAFKISQPVAAGSFVESGNAIGGRIAEPLAAGAFAESGKAIGLKIAEAFAAGALTAAGQPIGATVRAALLGPGAYAFGGVALPDDQFTTKCSTGAFSITGFDITFIEPESVAAPTQAGGWESFRRILYEPMDPTARPPEVTERPGGAPPAATGRRQRAPALVPDAENDEDDLILALILLDVL